MLILANACMVKHEFITKAYWGDRHCSSSSSIVMIAVGSRNIHRNPDLHPVFHASLHALSHKILCHFQGGNCKTSDTFMTRFNPCTLYFILLFVFVFFTPGTFISFEVSKVLSYLFAIYDLKLWEGSSNSSRSCKVALMEEQWVSSCLVSLVFVSF